MNEKQEPGSDKDIQESIWREICSYKAERQVGETVARPSTSGCSKCPPQAAENRKIMGVSVWGRSALFSTSPLPAEKRALLPQTERLWVFRFGAEVPSFRQAMDWLKWEILWFI